MICEQKTKYSVCNHLVIKQIGLPLRGRPILLIRRMITARIGLQSVLLPLLITIYLFIFFIKPRVTSS